LRNTIFCHSRESGNPERFNFNRLIDTRFHGYDGFNLFRNSPIIKLRSLKITLTSLNLAAGKYHIDGQSYLNCPKCGEMIEIK